jgi:hypothetical protein
MPKTTMKPFAADVTLCQSRNVIWQGRGYMLPAWQRQAVYISFERLSATHSYFDALS